MGPQPPRGLGRLLIKPSVWAGQAAGINPASQSQTSHKLTCGYGLVCDAYRYPLGIGNSAVVKVVGSGGYGEGLRRSRGDIAGAWQVTESA